jgi:LAS superfamily LD-carboxypeptidase LdcB
VAEGKKKKVLFNKQYRQGYRDTYKEEAEKQKAQSSAAKAYDVVEYGKDSQGRSLSIPVSRQGGGPGQTIANNRQGRSQLQLSQLRQMRQQAKDFDRQADEEEARVRAQQAESLESQEGQSGPPGSIEGSSQESQNALDRVRELRDKARKMREFVDRARKLKAALAALNASWVPWVIVGILVGLLFGVIFVATFFYICDNINRPVVAVALRASPANYSQLRDLCNDLGFSGDTSSCPAGNIAYRQSADGTWVATGDSGAVGDGSVDVGVGADGVACLAIPRSGKYADPYLRALARAVGEYENNSSYVGWGGFRGGVSDIFWGRYQYGAKNDGGESWEWHKRLTGNSALPKYFDMISLSEAGDTAGFQAQDKLFMDFMTNNNGNRYNNENVLQELRNGQIREVLSRNCLQWNPMCSNSIGGGRQNEMVALFPTMLAEEQGGSCGAGINDLPTNAFKNEINKLSNVLSPLSIKVNAQSGARPSSYSDLSSKHREFLAKLAQQRGYQGYQDAGRLDPNLEKAFAELRSLAAANNPRLTIEIVSGYRSYNDQVGTFFNPSSSVTNPIPSNLIYQDSWAEGSPEYQSSLDAYVARSSVSAPPGYSEHSTGLAIDIAVKEYPDSYRLNANAYPSQLTSFLEANAGNYGFELSYPQGSNSGAGYEPWHWRFIGNDTYKPSKSLNSYATSNPGSSNSGFAPGSQVICCPVGINPNEASVDDVQAIQDDDPNADPESQETLNPLTTTIPAGCFLENGSSSGGSGFAGFDGDVAVFPVDFPYQGPSGGQTYGACRDNCSRRHKGTDLTPCWGQNGITRTNTANAGVYAFRPGKVTSIGPDFNSIYIAHKDGSQSIYIHNASILVQSGEEVQAGQKIATVGGKGPNGVSEYVPHLHFEYITNGTKVDPAPFLFDNPSSPRANPNSSLQLVGNPSSGCQGL